MLLSLTDPAAANPALAGGKAATLAALVRDGFPVPDGFVVPAGGDFTPQDTDRLGEGRFAVRSSAIDEDLAEASFAGMYETYLDVAAADVADAVRRCRASAHAERVNAYRQTGGGMAVLVQRMVRADAAGVAFTADPVTGARDEVVVTAVAGLGEALVSGAAVGEEWLIRGEHVEVVRAGRVLRPEQAAAVAGLARRVAAHLGGPQDIEWAIAGGRLYLLQARPMTALPDAVAWQAPGPGLWLRNFRLGEWLPDPVTPLCADWLLSCLDAGFAEGMRRDAGAVLPFASALVHGWYYTQPTARLRALPCALVRSRGRLLPFAYRALVMPGRDPARAARGLLERLHRHWCEELLPAYQSLVRQPWEPDPASTVEAIGRMAGRHLWSLAVVGGAAWKMEACLARFLHRHTCPAGAQVLLSGLPGTDKSVPAHAVYSIDPYHPTAGEMNSDRVQEHGGDPAAARSAAERACRRQLAARPRALASFDAMLEAAQRYAVIREQQARDLTLGWPVLRHCLARLGHGLTTAGVLDDPGQVHFLTRAELDSRDDGLARLATHRRTEWQTRRRLVAPLTLGSPPPLIGRHLARTIGLNSRRDQAGVLVSGQPASPGRATGTVRVVTGPEAFAAVAPGEVLVTPATTPAWTPLFAVVAAVVTDGGTLAAHASLIAREYGIPAVVATGDATRRLRNGQIVTVDGTRGVVESVPGH